MTPLELHPGCMGWCPQANGGKGVVVGPLVPTGDALYFDGCFTDTFGSMWWSDGSPRTMHPFGPITAIAVPLPADAPVGSRWQCVRGNGWLGDKITVTIPGGYAAAFAVGDFLFIRLPDAAPKDTAMAPDLAAEVLRLRASIAELMAERCWQPIETAPPNTEILVRHLWNSWA